MAQEKTKEERITLRDALKFILTGAFLWMPLLVFLNNFSAFWAWTKQSLFYLGAWVAGSFCYQRLGALLVEYQYITELPYIEIIKW